MRTILVVEDEPVTRNHIVHVLTRRGFRVYEADSPAEAAILCSEMSQRTFDLAIIAQPLTDKPGRELAETILAACPAVKILHMGEAADPEMPTDSLATDISFLQKPFTPAQLLEAVDSALQSRRQ